MMSTVSFAVYCDRVLAYEHNVAPKVAPSKEINAARKESMSQIGASGERHGRSCACERCIDDACADAASQKKPKVMECASCNKSFNSKANEWVICSMCGGGA